MIECKHERERTKRASPNMLHRIPAVEPNVLYQADTFSPKKATGPPGKSPCSIHIICPKNALVAIAIVMKKSIRKP